MEGFLADFRSLFRMKRWTAHTLTLPGMKPSCTSCLCTCVALSLGKACLSLYISSTAVPGRARVVPLSDRSDGISASMPPRWYAETHFSTVL